MASESFKEDLLRGCGSFVEKLEKGEVRRAACSDAWQFQAGMSARQKGRARSIGRT